MTTNLGAWHGDPQLKADTVAELIKHREADAITKGIYQLLAPELATGFRGCAIGCLVATKRNPAEHRRGPLYGCGDECTSCAREVTAPNVGWHDEAERLFGIPERVALQIDTHFEAQDWGDAAAFAVDVIEAIPVGADLSGVGWAYSGTELLAKLRDAPLLAPSL